MAHAVFFGKCQRGLWLVLSFLQMSLLVVAKYIKEIVHHTPSILPCRRLASCCCTRRVIVGVICRWRGVRMGPTDHRLSRGCYEVLYSISVFCIIQYT